ncbi:MAG TPA: hypothetical protein VGF17_09650 [Phytomonospora sp.]
MKKKRHLLAVAGTHLPPNAPGTHEAKVESVDSLAAALDTARRALVIGDMNSRPGQSIPGPDALAAALDGATYGTKIDCAVGVGLKNVTVEYVPVVGDVKMNSDHHHAVRLTFRYRLRTWVVWFYNVEVARSNGVAAEEVRALLATRTGRGNRHKPLAVILCETTGYELPDVAGFDQIRQRPGPRANITMYVESGRLRRFHWLDQHKTWKRTDHPGEHDPRAFPVASIWLGRIA